MIKENNAKEKKRKDPIIILLDIIIIVLIFVMIYVGRDTLFYKMQANKSSTFSQDVEIMSFELQRGDYAGLIHGKYMNEINGKTETSGYHALADYIEAAFTYKVYDTKGYTEKANKQKAIMDEARVKMKELTIFADKADKMFMISY
ncbi:MAG: hypothetical protein J5537_12485 [Lachnospiraceae bacterium]|nr:hypothetical protein [Lachnospiraceae bacterium]